jgi:uncharacterized membrane protein YfcA
MAGAEIIPLIIIIAIVVGFLASMFGIGGGFLIVPTEMSLLAMEDAHLATGTSTFIIIFMSASAVLGYHRQKRIDYLVTGILLLASIPGTILGGIVGNVTSAQLLILLFGVIEMVLAIILVLKKTPEKELTKNLEAGACKVGETNSRKMWWILSRHIVDADGNREDYKANLLLAVPLSFLAGFLSTLLGIGGGTINIQILYFCCGMGIHVTIASSMFMIFITSITGTLTQFAFGHIDVIVGLLFAIGIVIGAQFGTRINKRIASQKLKNGAAIVIIFIAVYMIIKSYSM